MTLSYKYISLTKEATQTGISFNSDETVVKWGAGGWTNDRRIFKGATIRSTEVFDKNEPNLKYSSCHNCFVHAFLPF